MTQHSLKDYVAFITQFLECPEGEEWKLLRQHDHLVNLELVEMMEQIAQDLLRQGDSRSANFLHRWAQQIHQQLTQTHPPETDIPHSIEDVESTQATPQTRINGRHVVAQNPQHVQHIHSIDTYDEIIQALLDSPSGHENSILTNYKDFIDPSFVARMESISQQLYRNGNAYHAQYLMDIAAQLEQTLRQREHEPLQSPPPETEENVSSVQPSDRPTNSTPPGFSPPPSLKVEPPSRQTDHLADTLSIQLTSLLQTLETFTAAIATQAHTPAPLYYLDILEKAQANDWLLTTHELETVLGVKPHCSRTKTDYHKGGWRFRRCGKVGRETLWQIFKLGPEELENAFPQTQHSSNTVLTTPEVEPDPWAESTS